MTEQLTPEQTARFPEFVEKWTKIGLSCESADRPRAEAAIHLMYETGGLTQPAEIVWFDSPIAMFTRYKKTGIKPIWAVVRNAVRGAVWNDVQDAVMGVVYGAIGCAVMGAVYDAIGDVVGALLKALLRALFTTLFMGLMKLIG